VLENRIDINDTQEYRVLSNRISPSKRVKNQNVSINVNGCTLHVSEEYVTKIHAPKVVAICTPRGVVPFSTSLKRTRNFNKKPVTRWWIMFSTFRVVPRFLWKLLPACYCRWLFWIIRLIVARLQIGDPQFCLKKRPGTFANFFTAQNMKVPMSRSGQKSHGAGARDPRGEVNDTVRFCIFLSHFNVPLERLYIMSTFAERCHYKRMLHSSPKSRSYLKRRGGSITTAGRWHNIEYYVMLS